MQRPIVDDQMGRVLGFKSRLVDAFDMAMHHALGSGAVGRVLEITQTVSPLLKTVKDQHTAYIAAYSDTQPG